MAERAQLRRQRQPRLLRLLALDRQKIVRDRILAQFFKRLLHL